MFYAVFSEQLDGVMPGGYKLAYLDHNKLAKAEAIKKTVERLEEELNFCTY